MAAAKVRLVAELVLLAVEGLVAVHCRLGREPLLACRDHLAVFLASLEAVLVALQILVHLVLVVVRAVVTEAVAVFRGLRGIARIKAVLVAAEPEQLSKQMYL
jgi:hypothetical protein